MQLTKLDRDLMITDLEDIASELKSIREALSEIEGMYEEEEIELEPPVDVFLCSRRAIDRLAEFRRKFEGISF